MNELIVAQQEPELRTSSPSSPGAKGKGPGGAVGQDSWQHNCLGGGYFAGISRM